MPHGMLDPYFQQAEGRRLKALRNRIYWALIESDLIRNAEAVLFTCAEEMALASQTFRGYRPVDELNAGYGIARPPAASEQLQSAFRQQAGLDASTPFILFLSRIHPKKGADNLIDAYSKVYRRRLDEGKAIPMLVVAGPGMESEFGRSLRRKVDADSFLGSHVRFPGMLSGDAKWGAFYGSEVFILPSHQENFGIAVVEALACGKAVLISSKVNIFREIQDAGAGIVHSDDLDGCIRLLNDWLRMNASQRDEMQSRAAQLYEEVFTVARAAEQMRDVMGI
jgi:glycosyltransferase involved in cell wall biosynthesis